MTRNSLAKILTAMTLFGLLAALAPSSALGRDDGPNYRRLLSSDSIEQTVREMAALGTRLTGTEGADQAAEMIRQRLAGIGLDPIVHTFNVPVPIQREANIRLTDDAGREIPLHALWPNLTRTSSVHRDGLAGHLVYLGKGEYDDFDKLDLDGAIALMEFDSGENMVEARVMGAKAVIFIEPELAFRTEGEQKWLDSPADIPRFWVSKADAEPLVEAGKAYRDQRRAAAEPFQEELGRLRAALTQARAEVAAAVDEGQRDAQVNELRRAATEAAQRVDAFRPAMDAALDAVPKRTGRLFAQIEWVDAEGKNIWAYLPGSQEAQWAQRYEDALARLRTSLRGDEEDGLDPQAVFRMDAQALADGTVEEPEPEHRLAWTEKASLWNQTANAAVAALHRMARPDTAPRTRREEEVAEVVAALDALEILAVRPLARADEDWRGKYENATQRLLAAVREWDDLPSIRLNVQALNAAAATKPSHQVVALQAHYDSMSVVPTLAPGAEQATGVATLLELARLYQEHPPKRSVVFVATAGHAQMLRGFASWLLAHSLPGRDRDRFSMPEFTERFNEDQPVVFDMLVGLHMSSGTERMGAFFESHAGRYLRRPRRQAQSFFRAYGARLVEWGREVQGQERIRQLEEQMAAQGEELAPATRDLLLRVMSTEDTFEFDDLHERLRSAMGADAPDRDELGLALRAALEYGVMRLSDAEPGERRVEGWETEAIVYDADPPIQNGVTAVRGVVWTSLIPSYSAFDAEMCSQAGLPGLTLATVNDARHHVDTPHDTPDRVNFANLEQQARLAAAVMGKALNHTDVYTEARVQIHNDLSALRGQITEFRLGKSILADFPVPDVVVHARTGSRHPVNITADFEHYKTMTGVRTGLVAITDQRGFYRLPEIFYPRLCVEPLRYDADTARLVYAGDRGVQGAQHYALMFDINQPEIRWRNVVFRCESLDLFGADDPRYLRKLNQSAVLSPLNFAPTAYGHSWLTGRSQTVYFAPEERVKVIMGSGVFGNQYLLTRAISRAEAEAAEDPHVEYQPEGIGYGNVDERGRFVSAIFRTPERVVRDTLVLNEYRMDSLRRHGIENNLLATLQQKARMHYEEALDDYRDGRIGLYADNVRAARGFAARAYPDVMGTATDTVKGLVFYFALLIPFSVFCERLLFAATDIRKRIAGVVAIFVAIFIVMYFAHPAFRIAENPWIIFVAFVLMAMSVFVISIVVTKFNEQISKLRRTESDIHETDVGRLSASFAAFNLGINNMRKRKVRTFLTTATIVLLMFTVLSFTSVETYTSYNEIPVPDAEATYAGALLRDRNWNVMEEMAWRYSDSAFRQTMKGLVPRAWYMSVDPESDLHLRVEFVGGGTATNARGAVGLTPEETLATGLDRALLEGHRWFSASDEASCLISVGMAERLGIDAESVRAGGEAAPRIRVFGRELAVIGILDPQAVPDRIGLDGGNITPVDVTDVASRGAFGAAETVATVRENPTELGTFRHLSLDSVVILPYETLMRAGGTLRSIAVVRPDDMAQEEFLDSIKTFMQRVAMTVFVSAPQTNRVTALSSLARSSFSGLQGLFIPIAIAALIVLNTMMGSVYERFKEIGIYSSVGLAPVHIAALFIAESCVYAVLGAIMGYLLGQVVGSVLFNFGWLGGMTLNYSSMSAVFSTVIVMAVVVLSSLYPSKVASSMSVPDVTRRWKFPEPEGDSWVFDFPFTVASDHALGLYVFLNHYFEGYTEESVGSFYTDRVSFGAREGEYGMGYVLRMMVWLAPFDMGVSQWVEMCALQTEDAGIARIQVNIHRETGEVSAWKRLNKGFLTDIRKQFLVWRTIPADVKVRYADEGRERLGEAAEAPTR